MKLDKMSSSVRSNGYRSATASDTGMPENGGRAQWSTQALTIDGIVERCALPQIVKCNQQSLLLKRDSPLPVNLAQPILLYNKRSVRKLLARNVVRDRITHRYTENDETIVIPSDYDGLFLRLGSRTAKDAASHRTIESLVQKPIRAFVNLTRITAFAATSSNPSNEYPKIEYAAGNVFLVEKVVNGNAVTRSDSKLFNLKSNIVQQIKYLTCKDEKGTAILIPLIHTGEFLEVLPSPLGNGRLSINSESLIATQKFPLVIRYVSGKHKPRLTTFSGFFTLLDSFEESTVFGCVLDPNGFTLIEIPTSSPLTFQLALNMHELMSIPLVKKAVRICDVKFVPFCRDLKFKFKFAQRINQITGRKIDSDDEADADVPISATNSARFGVTTTYIYL